VREHPFSKDYASVLEIFKTGLATTKPQSPVLTPADFLYRSPRLVITVAEGDDLRSQSLRFAERAREARVRIDIKEDQNVPSMFMSMDMALDSEGDRQWTALFASSKKP
jgi:acetyl esterase/lipase